MALLEERPELNSSGRTTGHTSAQSPQAVQSFSDTYRAFFRILTPKLPTYPLTSITSDRVRSFILGCRPASVIFGPSIQMEQSIVGKVLSSFAIWPPMEGFFSTRTTS